jgi:hypothetical protein
MTYKYISTMTAKVKLVPDICFTYKPKLYRSHPLGVLVLDHVDEFRSGELKQLADSKMFDYMPMVKEDVGPEDVDAFLQMMNRHEYIISGRYHGCVFSMMLGRPFSGLISNTWKIESLMGMVGRAKMATNRVNKLCHGIESGAIDYGIDGQMILEEYKSLCEL